MSCRLAWPNCDALVHDWVAWDWNTSSVFEILMFEACGKTLVWTNKEFPLLHMRTCNFLLIHRLWREVLFLLCHCQNVAETAVMDDLH